MKTIKHEDIEVFPYELIHAEGDVWIKLTDALKMAQKAQNEIRKEPKVSVIPNERSDTKKEIAR